MINSKQARRAGSGARLSRTLAALIALGCGWLACAREAARPGAEKPASQPRAVETAVVSSAGGAGSMSVPATVQARERARLTARIPASVVALPWREGDRVQRGALVARLDDAAQRSGLHAAETASRAAGADLARIEALVQKGAATAQEAEASRTRAAVAAAAVSAAAEALAQAVLRAPFDGTIAARPASVGDVVAPGATLIEIEGTSGLELQATVESELAAGLRPGSVLHARVDGQAADLKAVVRAVSASGDPATHRFEVKADLPASPGLRSGLFARLTVPVPGAAPRLVVPQAAVFERGGLTGIVVFDGGTAHLRWIAAGRTSAGLTEIRAGASVGERVVLNPRDVADGDALQENAASAR